MIKIFRQILIRLCRFFGWRLLGESKIDLIFSNLDCVLCILWKTDPHEICAGRFKSLSSFYCRPESCHKLFREADSFNKQRVTIRASLVIIFYRRSSEIFFIFKFETFPSHGHKNKLECLETISEKMDPNEKLS